MPEDSARDEFLRRLRDAQHHLDLGFEQLPPAAQPLLDDRAAKILHAAAGRLRDDDPYGHPLYAGQMLKPPHPIARAAYSLAMSVNPNNHALDGGRASSAMELEAVAALAGIFGWNGTPAQPGHLGHLTSGGTLANLEALWVAGQIAEQEGRALTVAASDQAHYTHSRISAVLKLPFTPIRSDGTGRMDLNALEAELRGGRIGTVVATLGTTAGGAVDPLDGILALRERYRFRLHVDAAYGGYFTLARNLSFDARAAFDALNHPAVDSIVIDPHKHGLQPYGCGCVLFHDPSAGQFYKHDSPYTYFTSRELHLGEISLECSRAGASAVALWATQQLLPYEIGGEFARGLESGREAAFKLHQRLAADARFLVPFSPPQLDIVFWAVRGDSVQESSARAQTIFDEARRRNLYLALAKLPRRFFPAEGWTEDSSSGANSVTCLRSVQMKPEHLVWADEIWRRLDAASAAVLQCEKI
ncbi:MAG TPA: pyridoxal-dependent decarboxylase [Acidobacteriaceae bacterium]|nr:pyridoxal-dependent decarboxylase [Acidobacteriaceae bacterium]